MAVHAETVLLQRVCHHSGCLAVFFLCPHCDRGHRYCSIECRNQARLHQRRCANGRHQRSPEGRLDHRDRQREYRQRQSQAPVTDQGSLSITSPALFDCGAVNTAIIQSPIQSITTSLPRWPDKRPGVWVCCRICGRSFRFVNPFPRIPRRM